MEKTLLFEAFSTLTPAEIREFGKFVRSPFFNTRPQAVALYEYLAAAREKGNMPDAAGAGAAIMPPAHSTLPPEAALRLANSALLALLEQF